MQTTVISALVLTFLPQTRPEPIPPTLPPAQFRPAPQSFVRPTSQRVKVRIVDGVATTELEQSYFNSGAQPGEEIFLLPIPPDTAVTELVLTMNGQPVKGEVLDKDKARQIYNSIVQQRRDPALLEYAGYGLIRASIFPVPPNGEAKVAIKYTSMLQPSSGLLDYNFPLRATVRDASALRSLVFEAQIESSQAIVNLYSPSHRLDIVREGDRKARLSFEGVAAAAATDFRLLYGIANAEFGLNLLSYKKGDANGTFLLFLAPKADLPPGKTQPKDLVFVLDSSGSMAGEKIRQAKEALKFCLNRLAANDRFNLVRFSTEAQKFRDSVVEANAENIKLGIEFIDQIEARGGTNIDEALQLALTSKPEGNRLYLVSFLTDGLPTVGETNIDRILGNARARNAIATRVFTFGVGDDVNTRLLDTLAEETRATRSYVRPNENIEIAVSGFYDQISMPVLANLALTVDGAEIFDFYPKRLPDLFKGSQILVAGRFRGEGRKKVRLAGEILGEKREWIFEADFATSDTRNEFLSALWAQRKVGFLLDELRLRGANPELVQEITRLGKEFGIVTPYTSHLVVEEQARVAQNLPRRHGPLGGGGTHGGTYQGPNDTVPQGGAGSGGPAPGPSAPSSPGSPSTGTGSTGVPPAEAEAAREKLRKLGEGKAEESGKDAVKASQLVAHLSTGQTLLDATSQNGLKTISKKVGEKLFLKIGEYWVDAEISKEAAEKAENIEFASEAYFRLLEQEPELQKIFALGQKLLVIWKGKALQIS